MSEQTPQRRLAAILAADVVGYSRMMQADEAGTLAALKSRRTEILQPLVSKHHGRIIKVMGDGVLIDFASAVEAVNCAVALQGSMAVANEGDKESQRIVLRIGINLGDVIVEGSDLYGDGINVAARLEGIAEAGSIFVSGKVRSERASARLCAPGSRSYQKPSATSPGRDRSGSAPATAASSPPARRRRLSSPRSPARWPRFFGPLATRSNL
jgi:class 3 adenylate cyclase